MNSSSNAISLANLPTSDPAVVLRFRDRQYAADLLGAAILKFDLFTLLGDSPGMTLQQLCQHYKWQVRPTDVLLTLCRASGLIVTDAEGACSLSDVGRDHLTAGSPSFLGPYFQPIADSPILEGFVRVLQTGKPANWQAKSDGADWHESMKDPDFANQFTALMNCRGITFGQHLAASLAPELQSRRLLLDVGGGSGIYASTMVARHPHLRATVLEQSPVDKIAEAEIRRHGLSDRVSVLSADMFNDPWLPKPDDEFDVILLSNLLHDWGMEQAQVLVDKAAQTLSAGGLLIIHGAIINDDKTGPLPVAEYSALLMNITQGKCYSTREYGDMVTAAGLLPGEFCDTTGDRGYVTATKVH